MNYDVYQLSAKEKLLFLAEVLMTGAVISYLFYHSVCAMVLCIPLSLFLLRRKKKRLIRDRKSRLNEQFKDGILAVAAALKAGYSIENAFIEALKDLQLTYQKESDIVKEFQRININVKNNVVLEKLLMDFADRSHIEDIRDFTGVFAIAKRKGGDLNKIIQNAADIIREKAEVRMEIEILLTAKQFEQRIMSVVPVFIIFYVSVTSPHFFDVLYHNPAGNCIMSGCLAVYGFSIYLAEKITTIDV